MTEYGSPTGEQMLSLYETMLLIRRMEERLGSDWAAGRLPGAVHLYIGQEAVAAGVCAHLRTTDRITSTHRGHGHFLAKGGDPKAMMAEIWGKRTGACRGMGGSMHVTDISKGIMGANGIVAGGLAIAVGSAFAAKLAGDGCVSVAFFGDGAANEGVFMECLNISTLWQLPMVFVCEHNQFSEFSPSATVTAGQIVDRARAFKIPCEVVDGNDVVAVWRAGGEAVQRARNAEGPTFIEAQTYRIHGHAEFEEMILGGGKYREKQEIEEWRGRDPIARFRECLLSSRVCTEEQLSEVGSRIAAVVEDAAKFAEASEPADPELAFDLMFAGQQP